MTDGGADALPRPPRRCTPEQFYGEYVPQVWDNLASEYSWPSYAFEINFEIKDASAHQLRFNGGTVTGAVLSDKAANPGLFTVRCDQEAWQLAVRDVIPRVVRRTNKKLDRTRRNMKYLATKRAPQLSPGDVANMPGELTIDFRDDAGDRGVYRVQVGAGAAAKAKIEATEDDLWSLLDSESLVSFLKSRAQLDGDVAYVIKLARYFEGD